MMALAFYSTLLGFMVPQLRDKFGLSLNPDRFILDAAGHRYGMTISLVLCFCIFSAFNSIKDLRIFQ